MDNVVINFLSWFFPDIVSVPAPVQVIVGSLFLTLFFGLVLKITKR